MRDLHSAMLAALLGGEGLRGVAELAAAELGSPVAILLPARGLAAGSDDAVDPVRLDTADERVKLSFPITAGDQVVGHVLALIGSGNGRPSVDREEVLRTAALAALTELAVADARDELATELRGSLLEDLRAGDADPDEMVRRAARLRCDLRHGVIALVAEVRTERPRHVAALIVGEHPGAIAEPLTPYRNFRKSGTASGEAERTRVYALLPALDGDDPAARTLASAQAAVSRLGSHGPAAFSSFCESPEDLGRAVAEAELMLDVIARDERMASQLTDGVGDGVYRLLFRALASDPEEVRRFYLDTVAPLVEHDRQYRTDLLGTLEAYLANDCNMNATARAVYAHRHTVAHRLNRVRELSGLDPGVGEDRERLGLGIKAFRILEPTLPK